MRPGADQPPSLMSRSRRASKNALNGDKRQARHVLGMVICHQSAIIAPKHGNGDFGRMLLNDGGVGYGHFYLAWRWPSAALRLFRHHVRCRAEGKQSRVIRKTITGDRLKRYRKSCRRHVSCRRRLPRLPAVVGPVAARSSTRARLAREGGSHRKLSRPRAATYQCFLWSPATEEIIVDRRPCSAYFLLNAETHFAAFRDEEYLGERRPSNSDNINV